MHRYREEKVDDVNDNWNISIFKLQNIIFNDDLEEFIKIVEKTNDKLVLIKNLILDNLLLCNDNFLDYILNLAKTYSIDVLLNCIYCNKLELFKKIVNKTYNNPINKVINLNYYMDCSVKHESIKIVKYLLTLDIEFDYCELLKYNSCPTIKTLLFEKINNPDIVLNYIKQYIDNSCSLNQILIHVCEYKLIELIESIKLSYTEEDITYYIVYIMLYHNKPEYIEFLLSNFHNNCNLSYVLYRANNKHNKIINYILENHLSKIKEVIRDEIQKLFNMHFSMIKKLIFNKNEQYLSNLYEIYFDRDISYVIYKYLELILIMEPTADITNILQKAEEYNMEIIITNFKK